MPRPRTGWTHCARTGAAYGWTDHTAEMPDDEILRRLLALNLQRATAQGPKASGRRCWR
ncbi:hypothetical protein [Ottowia sp.]|uniref:hypothetical protein n=1 Tax=Ottowia sp. TaxID=1898956 RepID=UPI0025CFFF71|nr:hypothetical protein [Ottowia sp.]MBK6613188.1 hypothetical protein [Ottowia sp.]MBK6747702.1 hypothetical protein [Ottowia sp.]